MRRAGGRTAIAAARDRPADTGLGETRQMNAPGRRIFYVYEKKTLQLFMFIVRGEILERPCPLPSDKILSKSDGLAVNPSVRCLRKLCGPSDNLLSDGGDGLSSVVVLEES